MHPACPRSAILGSTLHVSWPWHRSRTTLNWFWFVLKFSSILFAPQLYRILWILIQPPLQDNLIHPPHPGIFYLKFTHLNCMQAEWLGKDCPCQLLHITTPLLVTEGIHVVVHYTKQTYKYCPLPRSKRQSINYFFVFSLKNITNIIMKIGKLQNIRDTDQILFYQWI